jgi:hypothetical protein
MLSASQWTSQQQLTNCPGPSGASGPSGPSGASGPTGATGPVASSGPTGPIGPTGVIGPTGPSPNPLNQVINLVAGGSGKIVSGITGTSTSVIAQDNVITPASSGEVWFLSARGSISVTRGTPASTDSFTINLQQLNGNLSTIDAVGTEFVGNGYSNIIWSVSGYVKTMDTSKFVVYINYTLDATVTADFECNGYCATKIS